jgi:probable HAF family extracellular repeat protein
MKSRILILFTAMTLFAALVVPVRLTAQDNRDHHHKHHRYRLIDMGTFGGPASYLTEPGFGFGELVLNSRGEVAGKSDTSTPNKGSGNCPPICFDTTVFRWERGVLTPLDGLSTVINNSDVASINSRGWIAGNSATGDIDPITGGQIVHGVLWKKNKPIDLGTLGGLESTAAYVNDGGEVVGFSTINTIPDPFSFLGGSIHPFIWKNGVMRDLGTLGSGTDALPGPSCTNERSHQVTGGSFIDSTPNPTGVPTVHPFLWENGKMTDLGTLGGTLTAFLLDAAQCVNNRGQVAGVSTLPGDQIIHPFLWDHGVLTDLGTLGGDFTITTWLNDAGEVVGGTTTAGEATFHATLWRDGAVTDLGTLEGDCGSLAHSINSTGQIVGESDSCDGITIRAVLWDKAEIVDLNTLIPPNSSLQLGIAANVNDRGEIAGWGGRPAGCEDVFACGHAFLLIPCGENHGDSECEDEGEGTAVARGETNQGPNVVLPENVRRMLQRRLRFGRFGAQLPRPQ